MFRHSPLLLAIVAAPCAAQDIPGTSPLDHNAMSRALTSSQIDNDTLDAVTEQKRRAARTTASKPRTARRQLTPEQAKACVHSTRILRSMGLAPAAECL